MTGEGQFQSQELMEIERKPSSAWTSRCGSSSPRGWRGSCAWTSALSMWTGSPIARRSAALRAVAAARDHGHDRGHPARDSAGHPRRAQAGHLGGLCGARLLDRGAGDALVLARHPDDPGAARLLPVDAADGVHADLGRPVAEPGAADLAGARGRLPVLGGGDAHDALGDARGAARGLHPHRAREGAVAEAHPLASRAEERDAAGAHRHRPGVRVPDRRPGGDRAGVQPERAGDAVRRVDLRAGTTRSRRRW